MPASEQLRETGERVCQVQVAACFEYLTATPYILANEYQELFHCRLDIGPRLKLGLSALSNHRCLPIVAQQGHAFWATSST